MDNFDISELENDFLIWNNSEWIVMIYNMIELMRKVCLLYLFYIWKVNLMKVFINVNYYILIIVRIFIECFKSMFVFVIIGKIMKNLLRFVFL